MQGGKTFNPGFPARVLVAALAIAGMVFILSPFARAASPVDGFNPNPNGTIKAVAIQDDGSILVGGSFTTIGGVSRNHMARLNADGSVDTSFDPSPNNDVEQIALQPDGKILVNGQFTTIGGEHLTGLVRLNTDGTVDLTFNNLYDASASIFDLVVQPDGKFLLGGSFTNFGGTPRDGIVRYNADGTFDSGFSADTDSIVESIAVQADGKIIVGGWFNNIGGTGQAKLARLYSDGSVDMSFDPYPDNDVYTVDLQPDGKILVGGVFGSIHGTTRIRLARLNGDGSVDTSFDPGYVNGNVQAVAYDEGKVLFTGSFTAVQSVARNHIARLYADGSLESDFDPGADSAPTSVVVQGDSKIVLGGGFSTIDGETRNNLARLNADGSVEKTLIVSFQDGAVLSLASLDDGSMVMGGSFSQIGIYTYPGVVLINGSGEPVDTAFVNTAGGIYAIAVQSDGKILLGGSFTESAGVRYNLVRYDADGLLDTSFSVLPNAVVNAIALEPDGQIVIGGTFTSVDDGTAYTRNRMARINADGTVDAAFDPDVNGTVYAIAVQADGKILIGGDFTKVGGTNQSNLARLNSDGTLDTGFTPAPDGIVRAIAVESDGRIVVGGDFLVLAKSTPRDFIGRLNSDGTVSSSMTLGTSGPVNTIVVQGDGKIIIGGNFTVAGATQRMHIARINSDGTLDSTFDPYADNNVHALALQEDGKLLMGGEFDAIGGEVGMGGTVRPRFARLTSSGGTVQELTVDSRSTVTWSRSGYGPTCSWVVFQDSADGVSWTDLGEGSAISGGWQITGLSLPGGQDRYVRASCYAPADGGTSGSQITTEAQYRFPQLSISLKGTGSGLVQSSPAGIDCGGTCTATFDLYGSVDLTATADSGSVFMGWTGCADPQTNPCTVTVDTDMTIEVAFAIANTLTVNVSPSGGGTVTGTGISCEGDCTEDYSSGTPVTLTAAPTGGYTFDSWTGCDSPSSNQCTMTMDANKTVTANFAVGSAPSQPAGITISAMKSGGPTVNWDAVGDATSYKVYCSTDGSSWTLIDTVTPPTTTYTDTGATSNTFYYWTVTAENGAGESAIVSSQSGRTALLNGWNMISAPKDTSGSSATQVFGAWADWSWYWEPAPPPFSNPDEDGNWTQDFTVKPGYSLFVWTSGNATVLSASGTDGSGSVEVTLVPGWNLISNHTPTNMTGIKGTWLVDGGPTTLDEAISGGTIGNSLYWWNGSTYDSYNISTEVPTVEPWKGYWILNQDTVDHTLTIQ